MLKIVFEALLAVVVMLSLSSMAFSYTDEEQYVYDNLYLQLPWEPARYIKLTQENRDTPTHSVGGVDEYALDFGFIESTPVTAAESGVVYVYRVDNTNASAYGNHIKIDHGHFYTLYAHLSTIEDGIDGSEVKKGDVIGLSGHTGVGSGSHLHFGLYYGYAYNDGYSYSVQSKIVSANEGTGPYQTLQSLQFNNGQFYLSGNFKSGQEGIIVCESNGCYVDTSSGVGGNGSLPDFITKKIWFSNSSGNPKTVFKPGEAMQIHIEVKNVGADTPSGIDVDYFRSNGLYKDSDPKNIGTDFIHKDDLEGGETHNELKNTTAPITKGRYNFVACPDPDHNVAEEHENNNCSDEAVFKVDDLKWLNPIINYILD
jgi:murein DD-endopeptidase MepM/ murein hydrolase activator NlpD